MTVALRAGDTLSIGEVIVALSPDFPDLTISKIRYLETEGLVEPQRSGSGYRRFSHDDVARLRYVLTAQRDHYLPLRVIKDCLEAIDQGLELSGPASTIPPPRALRVAGVVAEPDTRLSRADLIEQTGIDEDLLDQVESYGLVTRGRGPTPYDGDAAMIVSLVAELASYGLEPRNLRAVKTAADRQIGLVEQVVAPLARQRGTEAKARAEDTTRELASLSLRLHAALVMAGLRR